jgi:1,2-phenylacetyl-CoA epoxidase catalytic subunit
MGGLAYLVQGTAAAIDPTWSWTTGTDRSDAIIASFFAASGSTTITLATAGWAYSPKAVTMAQNFALAEKSLTWSPKAPTFQSSFALATKAMHWVGNAPTFQSITALVTKSLTWVANAPTFQSVIAMAKVSWNWIAQGIVIPVSGAVTRLLMLLGVGS